MDIDLLNSEKIAYTFGTNGYYNQGEMMNWFSPPTAIKNVNGIDYEATPHGVPTDEFEWIKRNKLNRARNLALRKNSAYIMPTALPQGDRLEDSFFNAAGRTFVRRDDLIKNPDLKKNLNESLNTISQQLKTEDSSKKMDENNDGKILGMSKGLAIGVGVIVAVAGFVAYKIIKR